MSIETKEGLFALMEQIAEEREAARPIVEQLLASGEPLEDIEIPEGWRTAGMVLELCEAATALSDANPICSLQLQLICISIAYDIDVSYPAIIVARLKANAWKEIGFTHFVQNAYEASFHAHNTALAQLSAEPALGYEQAKVVLRYGSVLIFGRRHEEALRLVESTARIFAEFGDQDRVAVAQFAAAVARHHRGELGVARKEYESLIPAIERTGQLDTLARLYNNLGSACRDLGDRSAAAECYRRSKAIQLELGNLVQVDKVDWGIARLMMVDSDFVKAEPIFRRLRSVFLARRMPDDAGEVALDIVEVLVATNRLSEAKDMTEQAIREFREAGLNDQAITAVHYLRDLLSTPQQARQAVKRVRAYVEKSKTEPDLLFLPFEP